MSTIKANVLALMIPLAFAAPALAQQGPGNGPGNAGGFGPQMLFSELDSDGDGAVTLEEMQGAHEGRFAQADADGDGRLSREEMVAQAMTRAEAGIDRLLERADADGDGALSEAELDDMRAARRVAGLQRMFERADANGDGQLSEAEFEASTQRMGAGRGDRGERRGHGHGHGFWRG
jgi:Ca2+-binding EF-hand superfamily protein